MHATCGTHAPRRSAGPVTHRWPVAGGRRRSMACDGVGIELPSARSHHEIAVHHRRLETANERASYIANAAREVLQRGKRCDDSE